MMTWAARMVWVAALVPMLFGCAISPKAPSNPVESQQASSMAPQFLEPLIGGYQSIDDPLFVLVVDVATPSTDAVTYQLTQSRAADESRRIFALRFSKLAGRWQSRFAPQTTDTSFQEGCPLSWVVPAREDDPNRLWAETNLETCQFEGPGGQRIGLLKEMVLTPQRITIADQLIAIEAPNLDTPASVIDFYRIRSFTGWAGVLEGDAWRISEISELPSDRQRRALNDASSMPLNLAVTLGIRRIGDEPKLQLLVSEPQSGTVLGQAWTDPNAKEIGWANDRIQVALTAP